MFTMKKSIFAKSIALILVIVMIAAFALTACSDKKAQDAADKAQDTANTAVDDAKKAADEAAELAKKVEELTKAIAALEEKDGEKIEQLKKDLEQAKKDLAKILIEKESWDAMTDVAVSKMDELEDVFDTFMADSRLYGADELDEAYDLWTKATMQILRAYSVEKADEIIADLQTSLDAILTIPESLKATLDEIAVDGVEYPKDGELLEKAKDLIDRTLGTDLYAIIIAYGDPAENLEEIYNTYLAEYIKLLIKGGAQELKNRMDEVLAGDITLEVEDTVDSIISDFEAWANYVIADAGATTDAEKEAAVNAKVAEVTGFDATIDKFEEVVDRIEVLNNAKIAAEAINQMMDDLIAAGIKADPATSAAIANIESAIAAWSTTYAIPVDAEAEGYIEANANLVDNAKLASIKTTFDERTKAFKKAFEEFVSAVNAIGTVTPESGEAIDTAWTAYFKCAALNQIADLDAILGLEADENIAHYYAKLSTAARTYEEIVALIATIEDKIDALAAFDVRYKFADDADKADYDAKVADIATKIADIDADITTLTETYKQEKTVIDAEKLAALDNCRLIPAKDTTVKAIVAEYEALVGSVTGDANETAESKKLKLLISAEQQIKYVLAIKFTDTFGAEGNVTSLDEIARCGVDAYINAQFQAALEYVPTTFYAVKFVGIDGVEIADLEQSIGSGLVVVLPVGPAVDGKVFKGWKASETSPVIAAGVAVPVNQALTFTAEYADGVNAGDFTLAAGTTKEVLNIKKAELDSATKIVAEFKFSQNGTVNGGDNDNSILTINGQRTLRVTGGYATHLWNEIAANSCGNEWWGYQASGYPDTKIEVRVTIDLAANTITVEAGWGVFDGTLINRTWTITDDGTYLGGDDLVLSFGGANMRDLAVEGCTVAYKLAD